MDLTSIPSGRSGARPALLGRVGCGCRCVYGLILQVILYSLPLAVGLGGLALWLALLEYAGDTVPALVKLGGLVGGACAWGAIVWGVVRALDPGGCPPVVRRSRPISPELVSLPLEAIDLERYRDRIPAEPWLN